MNRIRMTAFASVLAVGGMGLVAASAHAQAPGRTPSAVAPGYYYGWGYNGAGYYYNPAAPSVATYRGGYVNGLPASSPANMTAPSAHRESATGRYVNLAKPWLRPLQ